MVQVEHIRRKDTFGILLRRKLGIASIAWGHTQSKARLSIAPRDITYGDLAFQSSPTYNIYLVPMFSLIKMRVPRILPAFANLAPGPRPHAGQSLIVQLCTLFNEKAEQVRKDGTFKTPVLMRVKGHRDCPPPDVGHTYSTQDP